MILECFETQTYPNKELILIGTNCRPPYLPPNVRYLEAGDSSIGEKLNLGVKKSEANFFCKWDDDDWYSPEFIKQLIGPLIKNPNTVSFVDSHLVLDLKEWALYDMSYTIGGGTICFDRKAWETRNFPDLSFGEDQAFYLNRDQIRRVTPTPRNYVLVRHGQNTWKTWSDGKTVEQVAKENGKLVPGGPESFFSKTELEFYQSLR
jgi:glycosyltransferase involved in cell wall biosynthesis